MDSAKQPGIKVDRVLLVDSVAHRHPIDNPSVIIPKSKFDFDHGYSDSNHLHGWSKFRITLDLLTETDEKELANFNVEYIGEFSVEGGSENMDLEDFLKFYSPAILLPYIRQHISDMTMRCGLPPFIIPPLNIPDLIKTMQKSVPEKEQSSS